MRQFHETPLKWYTSEKMKNVHTSVVPFYWIAKLLGLFPFSYEGKYRNGILVQKFKDIASTSISLFVFMFLYIANFFRNESVSSTSDILTRVWDLSLHFFLTTLLVSYLYQLSKWKSVVTFLALIEKFDEKVWKIKLKSMKALI